MRLPFIQCDDAPSGRVRFISPESVGSIVAYPQNEKGCFVITFIDKDGQGSASKTLPNVHNEPELRDWIDFHIRGVGNESKL